MPTPTEKKNPLKTIFWIYVVLDVIWATLVATFNSTVIHTIAGAAGAGATATNVGTTLGWILTFGIAMFQGAIFLIVVSAFIFVGMVIFGKKKSS